MNRLKPSERREGVASVETIGPGIGRAVHRMGLCQSPGDRSPRLLRRTGDRRCARRHGRNLARWSDSRHFYLDDRPRMASLPKEAWPK